MPSPYQSDNTPADGRHSSRLGLVQRFYLAQVLSGLKLMLGDAGDPANASRLALIPYTAPNGKIHSSIRSPAWTGPETLVYLAEELFYEGSSFLPDTFFTGRDIVDLDVSTGSPVYTVVPGTDDASSVAVTSEPGVIYYTLGGDTRVYRRDGAGAITVVHDFGAAGIARDVAISGNRPPTASAATSPGRHPGRGERSARRSPRGCRRRRRGRWAPVRLWRRRLSRGSVRRWAGCLRG